jgi:hypothetical protein
MKTIKTFVAASIFSLAAGFVSTASAQMPVVACQTPVGVFPMPGGIPQPGLPCFGPAGPGITVVIGGGFPGGIPDPRMTRFPVPTDMQGGPQARMHGRIAGAFGVNREGQTAAECVSQFGVSKPAAACVVGRLTIDELNKCFSDGIGGRGCFGDNNTLVSMIRGNFEAAQRERGAVNQGIRATTGISVGDIEKHGWKGGPNSEASKICNFLGC